MGGNPYYPSFYYPQYGASTALPQQPVFMPQPQMQQQPVQQAQPAQQSPQAPQAQTSNNGKIWVQGDDEVTRFYVGPNCSVDMWNCNEPYVYLKSADASGKPDIHKYLLNEVPFGTKIDESSLTASSVEYATKQDLQEMESRLKEDMASQVKMFSNRQNNNRRDKEERR